MDHPAKFTGQIIETIAQHIAPDSIVLDPFAGTGRIHWLEDWGISTVGVEIEPEWATMDPRTVVGDALALPFEEDMFDAIATSPCFGNRMADHHDARDASKRITYKHVLGRGLHPNNSGQLQWGPAYREFHELAWREATRVLIPAGKFVLNIKNHIRRGEVQYVTEWHIQCLGELGYTWEEDIEVLAPGMRQGSNYSLRADTEHVLVFTYDG